VGTSSRGDQGAKAIFTQAGCWGSGLVTAFSVRSAQSPRQWRVGDRLSEADVERLIAACTAGTSKRKLAEHYGISESSIKRLIRQHGSRSRRAG
jgi:hypothetical protein